MKLKLFITFFILFLTIGVVCASDNQTFANIQDQINNAEENQTIAISGTYSGDCEITLEKNLTIQGSANATLDGCGQSRIFNIENNNHDQKVTFKDISFINGFSEEDGGAILSCANTIFLNCKFINNHAGAEGGAAYIAGNATFINCTFIRNTAYEGGAIKMKANYLIEDEPQYGDISISGCTFKDNEATSCGGALSAYLCTMESFYSEHVSNYKCCNINNTIFENNTAGFAGAIYSLSNLTINNSKINENAGVGYLDEDWMEYFDGYAGFLYSGGFANIINTNITNNKAVDNIISARQLSIENSALSNNSAEKGTISIYQSTLTIKGTTLTNNSIAAIRLEDSKFENYKKNCFLDDNLNEIQVLKLVANKLTTTYGSGKTIQIKLVNVFTNRIEKMYFTVTDTKTKKDYYITPNSKGIGIFKASSLKVGTHTLKIMTDEEFGASKITTTVKITKAKTIVKAPKVTNKYKKSKYFKVTLKHKTTKKAVKNVWIKLKIGKKTYKIKTNSKGIAKFNTKKLKIGKYNVRITSGNSNYAISAKSKIVIKR